MKSKRFRTSAKPISKLPSPATLSYEGKLDSKKRIVIRGAQHKYYKVREQPNGSIVLTPQKPIEIEPISPRSMAMLESSIANFKKGIVSDVIDLSIYRKKFSSQSQPRSQVSNGKKSRVIARGPAKSKSE
jgi:hypothetical protein